MPIHRTLRRFNARRLLPLLLALPTLRAAPGSAQVKIMPLGDSITQASAGYNSYRRPLWLALQAAKYDVNFVGGLTRHEGGPAPSSDFDLDHEGRWGWTTDMMLPEVRQWALNQRPDIVLLHAGTNDCFGEKPVEQIRDNLGRLIDQLRGVNPGVKVLLAQLIPTSPPYEQINARITALNALLPALAGEKTSAQSPVVLVNHNADFSREAGVDHYDGAHPNQRGEEKMAARWYEALRAPALLGTQLPTSLAPGRQLSPAPPASEPRPDPGAVDGAGRCPAHARADL